MAKWCGQVSPRAPLPPIPVMKSLHCMEYRAGIARMMGPGAVLPQLVYVCNLHVLSQFSIIYDPLCM